MPRQKTKTVHSFSLRIETMESLRKVTEHSGVAFGMSAIVDDAVGLWLRRYFESPQDWMAARGLAVNRKPTEDEI